MWSVSSLPLLAGAVRALAPIWLPLTSVQHCSAFEEQFCTMSVTAFRLWKLHCSTVLSKQPRLLSVQRLNSSRLIFSRVVCPTSQLTTSRNLCDERDATKKNANDREQGNETKITQRQRLRKVFAEYGSIGVVFHISMSLTSLGIVYTAVKRSVLDAFTFSPQ